MTEVVEEVVEVVVEVGKEAEEGFNLLEEDVEEEEEEEEKETGEEEEETAFNGVDEDPGPRFHLYGVEGVLTMSTSFGILPLASF